MSVTFLVHNKLVIVVRPIQIFVYKKINKKEQMFGFSFLTLDTDIFLKKMHLRLPNLLNDL